MSTEVTTHGAAKVNVQVKQYDDFAVTEFTVVDHDDKKLMNVRVFNVWSKEEPVEIKFLPTEDRRKKVG